MKTKIKKALEEAAISTFEDTCFMYAVPELKEIQNNLKLDAAAEVRYQGDYTGKLLIETRGGLFSAIAANILSNDSPTPRQKRDALGEIANIICGNIVTCLGRSERGCKIESPRFLDKDKLGKEEQHGKPVSEITLNFNDGRADVKFFVDGYFDAKEKKN